MFCGPYLNFSISFCSATNSCIFFLLTIHAVVFFEWFNSVSKFSSSIVWKMLLKTVLFCIPYWARELRKNFWLIILFFIFLYLIQSLWFRCWRFCIWRWQNVLHFIPQFVDIVGNTFLWKINKNQLQCIAIEIYTMFQQLQGDCYHSVTLYQMWQLLLANLL